MRETALKPRFFFFSWTSIFDKAPFGVLANPSFLLVLISAMHHFPSKKCLLHQSLRDMQWTMNFPYRLRLQHDVLRHCFFPFFWCNLNGLQLFLRLEVSQKRPDARACSSHRSNASSSSSIISASKSHGNLLELQRWLFSKPTMFTWKLGRWVFGLQAIPCKK